MSRHLRIVSAVALLAALPACAGMITGGPLVKPGVPTGIIEVANASNVVVTVVLISSCGASTYGFNRMADREVIEPGATRRFTVSAGCWDVDVGARGVGEAKKRMTVVAGRATRYSVGGQR